MFSSLSPLPPSESLEPSSSPVTYFASQYAGTSDFTNFATSNQVNFHAPQQQHHQQQQFHQYYAGTTQNTESSYRHQTYQIDWSKQSPPPPPFLSKKKPLLKKPKRLFKRCQSDEWGNILGMAEQDIPTSGQVPFAAVFDNDDDEKEECKDIEMKTRNEHINEKESSTLHSSSCVANPPIVPAPISAPAEIQEPHDIDVVCGRGVPTNRHPGNKNFRSLVFSRREQYVVSTKKQKMAISRSVVDEIRQGGGRFLERDFSTGLWLEIADKRALEKTSQALRDVAAPLRKRMSQDLTFAHTLRQATDNEHNEEFRLTNFGDELQPQKRRRHSRDDGDDDEEASREQMSICDEAPPSPLPIFMSSPPLSPQLADSQHVQECDVYPCSSSFVRHSEATEEVALALKPIRESQNSPSSVFAFPI